MKDVSHPRSCGRAHRWVRIAITVALGIGAVGGGAPARSHTEKPPLFGRHWMAVTGKPIAASAGARIFSQGGNAIVAAFAMLGAVTTAWSTLSWGGETQALIYDPINGKVIAINALGVAPTGATPEYFHKLGMRYPPEYGPLAAVTPGTPGGLLTMLAEYGTMSLAQVLEPAIEMADGFPADESLSGVIEHYKDEIKKWPDSRRIMLPHLGESHEGPLAGELFRQPDLAATLRKLVDTERQAVKAGKSRKQAIYAAYDRFYKGDIAKELVASTRAQGGLFTESDLAGWKVKIEEPVHTSYKGIEVYKLQPWVQGPVMLQALNVLENFDLKSMGYDSARYIHTLYQAMNLAFADRDFYYGDPAFSPATPIKGLLSKDYARDRAKLVNPDRNDPDIRPGDPYPYENGKNPYLRLPRGVALENAVPAADRHGGVRPHVSIGHDQHPGGGRERLGGIGDPERRLGARGDRGQDRHRSLAAHAELRPRSEGRPLQRAGAGQAPACDAHAFTGAEGWETVSRILGAGRRHAGSEPAAILPERGRIRNDGAAGRRSGQHHQLSDARLVRGSSVLPRAPDAECRDAALGA